MRRIALLITTLAVVAWSGQADARHDRGPYGNPVRAVPLSLSVTYGFMNTTQDGAGETFGAYHIWLGYRYRPIPESFGPFIALGAEGSLSSYPVPGEDQSTVSIAPTFHVGLDWVPPNSDGVWPELSLFSVYFIGAYIIGPQSAYEYGQRAGVGLTFVPITLYSCLPNTFEVTRDSYVRDGEREALWHLKIGWGF